MFEGNKLDLRSYVQMFVRRKWFVIAPFVLVVLVAYVLSLQTTPLYKSSVVIQLESSRLITGELERVVVNVSETPKRFRPGVEEGIRRQVTSRTNLLELIDRLNIAENSKWDLKAAEVQKKYPQFTLDEIKENLMVKSVSSKIELYFPRRSNIFQITGKSSDPTTAYLIAKHLADIYIEESRKRELAAIRGSFTFSQEQMNYYKRKLDEADERLRKFQTGVLVGQVKDLRVNTENLPHVNKVLASLRVELQDKKHDLQELDNLLGVKENETLIPVSNRALTLRASLIEKTSDLVDLMIKFDWSSPELYQTNSEIAQTRTALRDELAKTAREKYTPDDLEKFDQLVQREIIKIDIEFLQHQESEMQELVRLYHASKSSAPSNELTLSRLQSEVNKYQELYNMFQTQARGSEIEEKLQSTEADFRYRIVEPAVKPLSPYNTDLKRKMMMAVMLGLGIGVGAVFFLEYIDQSLKSVEEVERFLGLPVLGTIPKMQLPGKKRSLLRYALPAVVVAMLLVGAVVFAYAGLNYP